MMETDALEYTVGRKILLFFTILYYIWEIVQDRPIVTMDN